MNKNLLAVMVSLALTNTTHVLHAEGNINAGKEKTASCSGCHGAEGNSSSPNFPKLAQQNPSYLKQQLVAFKVGSRKDIMMSTMAKGLSDTDMADIAAYYGAQKISPNPMPVLAAAADEDDDENSDEQSSIDKKAPKSIEDLIKEGSNLYRNGNLKSDVSACIACHGPHGEGNKPAAFPALHAQHAEYLIKTLSDFKSGARTTNPDNMMHMIAKKMTSEEIKAVAYRISMMK
ncbi:MAG: c-type cytochrome [Methylococcaceae bacterium]|jgi:cytochrome c553